MQRERCASGELKYRIEVARRWNNWTNESFETIRAALIEIYDAGESENGDLVDLREKLIAYKQANPRFAKMTAIEFGHELYGKYGRPEKDEAHHLVPRSYQKNYPNSLDVTANIVSLCSNCHNCLHYGSSDERNLILGKLYEDRKKRLKEVGLTITLNE